MYSPFLVAFTLLFVFVVKRYFEFRQAVRAIRNHPGFRTFLSSFGFNSFFYPPIPIPGVSIGPFPQWNRKYKIFEEFGSDIVSHISAVPTVCQNFYIADATVLKEVTSNRTQFPKPLEEYDVVAFWGHNVVVSEGDEWKRYRKASGPAFSEPNNKLVAQETVHVVNALFTELWGDQKEISVDHIVNLTRPIALFIIGAAGFGLRVSWTESDNVIPPGHSMSFKGALRNVSRVEPLFAKALLPDWFMRYSPIPSVREVVASFDELESYVMEMIQERRASPDKARHDLLSLLIEAGEKNDNPKLTDLELLGNVFILLLAGHETTAHTLGFTFALLALYQKEQELLYEDIKSVLQGDRDPTYEDLAALKRATAVFNETLRMFPPVVEIPKVAAEDTTLTTQNMEGEPVVVPIPKGSRIGCHVVALHYNPRYWKDPHTFKPDRFLSDWPRDAFLPFSSGPRACVGRRFFETEGITILTMFISKYKIELMEEPEFAHETFEETKERILRCYDGLTMAPVRVPLVFKRRN